jgi:hypothetical protein
MYRCMYHRMYHCMYHCSLRMRGAPASGTCCTTVRPKLCTLSTVSHYSIPTIRTCIICIPTHPPSILPANQKSPPLFVSTSDRNPVLPSSGLCRAYHTLTGYLFPPRYWPLSPGMIRSRDCALWKLLPPCVRLLARREIGRGMVSSGRGPAPPKCINSWTMDPRAVKFGGRSILRHTFFPCLATKARANNPKVPVGTMLGSSCSYVCAPK